MREVIFIAAAGALGALGRWSVYNAAEKFLGLGFPHGTFIANILGCFALGFVMHTAITAEVIPDVWRLAITVGFLGAFTTFSTFSYETVKYIQDGVWFMAFSNIAANLIIGLAATFAGLTAAGLIFNKG